MESKSTDRDNHAAVRQLNEATKDYIERGAAISENDSVMLINQAFAEGGRTQKELAELLGVSEGRVSQILNGDGNLRVATLARYLSALGFSLRMEADSTDGRGRQIGRRFIRTRKR